MNLIFIYGPPAVGKLTVSRELAALTGYKVFHNHLSIDAISPIFDFGTEPFGRLLELIRVETIAEAARQNVNLIYTFCYVKDLDDPHVEKMIRAVEDNGGETGFVLLVCEKDELEKRILEESRKEFGKVKTIETLNRLLENYELFQPVNARESLIIDNTNLAPQDAARQIAEHFKML